jgi:D-lactate dehydrogenase
MENNHKKIKLAVFSTKPYDKIHLEIAIEKANCKERIITEFYESPLNEQTVTLTIGFDAICIFVNDKCGATVVESLAKNGIKLILLRCAGFNNVDLVKAKEKKIQVLRVATYSPHAVAEHAVGLLLSLVRKLHKQYNRVREMDFHLDGLLGSDIYCKTVGIIGTGAIGAIFAKIMNGFGCKLLAYDVGPNEELVKSIGLKYVTLDELFKEADIISLHVPLFPSTFHLINEESIAKMKDGIILINTSRGALIDTKAVIHALKKQKIGGLGIDVYESEGEIFFENCSNKIITDDVLIRLINFPNVMLTPHSAYFTVQALTSISDSTVENALSFLEGKENTGELTKTVKVETVNVRMSNTDQVTTVISVGDAEKNLTGAGVVNKL